MITKIIVENFSVFPFAEFNFSSGLNVIIGENNTGKTSLIKLIYSVASAIHISPTVLCLSDEIKKAFNSQLGSLLHKVDTECVISVHDEIRDFRFRFNYASTLVEIDKRIEWKMNCPVFAYEGKPILASSLNLQIQDLLARGDGSMFWEHPETNLHPKMQTHAVKQILRLCESGVQVFITTHSLFLLREIYLLSKIPVRFFNFIKNDDGIDIRQADNLDEIGSISMLDEELKQSDRYMDQEFLH